MISRQPVNIIGCINHVKKNDETDLNKRKLLNYLTRTVDCSSPNLNDKKKQNIILIVMVTGIEKIIKVITKFTKVTNKFIKTMSRYLPMTYLSSKVQRMRVYHAVQNSCLEFSTD